jgi:competence protein CoiA
MQVYALNKDKMRVFVECAQKSEDYFCIECSEKVRVRGGPHKQLHFYHVLPKGECRLSGKSLEHLLIQNLISFQVHGAEQEVRFPKINRIADIAWNDYKIVFEVQCSPISQEEVKARNADYSAVGWSVIWILYDKLFNRKKVSAAEAYLLHHTHYFSDTATIYDQAHVTRRGIRQYFTYNNKKVSRSINLANIQVVNKEKFLLYAKKPEFLEERVKNWIYFSEGDLIDEICSPKCEAHNALLRSLIEQERILLPGKEPKTLYQLLQKYLFKAISSIHSFLIEKSMG